jgi:hypothetical protein
VYKGFSSATITPEQLIRNYRNSVKELSPSNIHETVDEKRSFWNADYPHRIHRVSTDKEHLLGLSDEHRIIDTSIFSVSNKRLTGIQHLFAAEYGHWHLLIYIMPDGTKEFSFNVHAGSVLTWHPAEARNNILHHYDSETYNEWKRVVMCEWDEASAWLMSQAKEALPGFKAWSVTADESSTRLMKSVDGISVVSHVAFLFL